eukprot:NODE_822_length_746_cov_313.751204_g813_i0.p1 GENE.NODE_822_length_746_cov_313.751204_g813_i0~~NODE_822_length_746_cov_313.751204_g813_i0.p1  ORF type:complete len:156 (-),score=3.04 NODE_822_length_746_cov_313.751204_g813_i0:225-692(-)
MGGRNPWRNPYDAGVIKVTASSRKHGYPGNVVDCERTDKTVFFTANDAESWVLIDFSPLVIKPSHYSMAHRHGYDGFYLRSWTLEGSSDGIRFEEIKHHERDVSLSKDTPVAGWELDARNAYSVFKITIDNFGNSFSTNALVVNCFEIYGSLKLK